MSFLPSDLNDPRVILEDDSSLKKQFYIAAISIAVIFLVLAGVGYYLYARQKHEVTAQEKLAASQQPTQWLEIVNQYPRTAAAGEALLRLADGARAEEKYAQSIDYYQQFLREFPKSPCAPSAELAVAVSLEVEGKKDDARGAYEKIIQASPRHPMMAAASLSLAKMLIAEGKRPVARQVLLRVTQFPSNSQFLSEAKQLLSKLQMEEQSQTPAASVPAAPASKP